MPDPNPETMPDKRAVARRFARAAATYDAHDFLAREVEQRILSRLELIALEPARMLDIGCGTGRAAAALMRRYPRASLTGIDLVPSMVVRARRRRRRWFAADRYLCADAEILPFADGAFDLVFSNLVLHCCAAPARAVSEARRVLREQGLFVFTMFGPDTLQELKDAFAVAGTARRSQVFPDMHDIGDMLGQLGFTDPVMEAEIITVEYSALDDLLADLRGAGAGNSAAGRQRGCLGRSGLDAARAAYESYRLGSKLPATFEIVYAHAWARAPRPDAAPGAATFPLQQLRRRR